MSCITILDHEHLKKCYVRNSCYLMLVALLLQASQRTGISVTVKACDNDGNNNNTCYVTLVPSFQQTDQHKGHVEAEKHRLQPTPLDALKINTSHTWSH
jgi:hypothetical protein